MIFAEFVSDKPFLIKMLTWLRVNIFRFAVCRNLIKNNFLRLRTTYALVPFSSAAVTLYVEKMAKSVIFFINFVKISKQPFP